MRGDDFRAAGHSACGRWLICVELQRGSTVFSPRSGDLPRQLDNCRDVLAKARQANWPVVHVHLRRQEPGPGVAPAARPMAGFEPLPSEAVFFRDGGPNSVEHPFWRMACAEEGSEALVIGFIHDRTCVAALASLSRSGVRVALVEDALGGDYAHGFVERRVEAITTHDLVGEAAPESSPSWLVAANAP